MHLYIHMYTHFVCAGIYIYIQQHKVAYMHTLCTYQLADVIRPDAIIAYPVICHLT